MALRPESKRLNDFKREILQKTGIAMGNVYYGARTAKIWFVGHTDSPKGMGVNKRVMRIVKREAKRTFGKNLMKVWHNQGYYPSYSSINVKVRLSE